MTEDRYTEKISRWLDNDLEAGEVTELQQHLAECTACRQTYQTMQQLDLFFRQAGATMAAPAAGFTHRVELRLAQVGPRKLWQIWLALGALLVGSLFFVGAMALFGGLTLVSLSNSLLDAGLFFQGLLTVIDSADTARYLWSMGALFLKTSFVTIQQPVFWLGLVAAITLTWLWLRGMQMLTQRSMTPADLML